MPYKFNGKEFDQETGLYYYGARYMNPRTSLWYGVDPLAEKYVSTGCYVYCIDNPIRLIDPDGTHWVEDNKKRIVWNEGITNKEQAAAAGLIYTPVRDKDLLRIAPIAYSFQYALAVPRAYSRRNSMLPVPHRDS